MYLQYFPESEFAPRRTGRTTRMILEAKWRASEGQSVIILMATTDDVCGVWNALEPYDHRTIKVLRARELVLLGIPPSYHVLVDHLVRESNIKIIGLSD